MLQASVTGTVHTSEHRMTYTFTLKYSKSSFIPIPYHPHLYENQTVEARPDYTQSYVGQHGEWERVSNPIKDCREEMGKEQLMHFSNWNNSVSVETGTWTTWADIDVPLCTDARCRCLHNPVVSQMLAVLTQSQGRL